MRCWVLSCPAIAVDELCPVQSCAVLQQRQRPARCADARAARRALTHAPKTTRIMLGTMLWIRASFR